MGNSNAKLVPAAGGVGLEGLVTDFRLSPYVVWQEGPGGQFKSGGILQTHLRCTFQVEAGRGAKRLVAALALFPALAAVPVRLELKAAQWKFAGRLESSTEWHQILDKHGALVRAEIHLHLIGQIVP